MADKNERSVYIGAVSGCNVISAEKAVVPANYSAVNSTTGHGLMAGFDCDRQIQRQKRRGGRTYEYKERT